MAWEKQKLTLNNEHYLFFCLQSSILVMNQHRVVSTVLFHHTLDLQSPISEQGTPALGPALKMQRLIIFKLNQPLCAFHPCCIMEAPRGSDAEKNCLVHCLVNPPGAGACGGKPSQPISCVQQPQQSPKRLSFALPPPS